MDTSEQYIKMADCTEIQKGHTPKEGDWLANRSAVSGTHIFVNYQHQPEDDKPDWELICLDYSPSWLIWLPTQDQLQEMLKQGDEGFWAGLEGYSISRGNTHLDLHSLLTKFGSWCSPLNDESRRFTSGEQLWLAFVQKELHGKVWNGSVWLKK